MNSVSPAPQPAAVRWPHRYDPAAADRGRGSLGELRREARHRVVVRTLDELPEPSLRLLAAMAVVDQEAPLPILAVIANVADAGAALEDLVEAGLVSWFPHGLAEPVGLSSEALRDLVYWNLPTPLRRAMHLAAAEQVSGVHGFRHALLGAPRRDPELAARLQDEAARYHLAGDIERAGTLLLWAADMSADPQERERRLLEAARWGRERPTAGWAAALGRRLTPLEPSVERNLFLGRLAVREARHEAAHALIDQARRLAGDRPGPDRAAVALATAALHADTGDLAAQEQAALDLLAQDRLPAVAREWSVYFAADAYGRIHRSADASLQRLELLAAGAGALEADRPGAGILRWARGTWLAQSGRATEAISDLQGVLRSQDGPAAPLIPLSHAYLGHALCQLGDWRAALHEAEEGIRAAEALGDRREAVPAAALTACISALRGDSALAADQLERVAGDQRALGPARYAVFPALAAARLAQTRGEAGRVLTALAPVAAQPGLFAQHQLWWRPLYVEALIGTGRLAAAHTALATLRAAVGPRAELVLARLEARLFEAEGGPAAGIGRLAGVVEQPADGEWPFGLAELEHDYGRLLLAARRRRPAIRWLRSAHDRYAELGARPFADRCLALLQEAGVPAPQAGPGTGGEAAAALTDHEYRIALLAAEGMTNPQIARALFVSAKTIEYHLGNAFAKLGIASRRQLRAALDALDALDAPSAGRAARTA